ncbi:MAG: hypothetical protein LC721_07545 [Actinobacteria bacterium]|nr:hypothetical protein [Actinomycetota bacterium]
MEHPVTDAGSLRRRLRWVGRTGLALISAAVLVITGCAWTLSRQLDASLTTSAVLDRPDHAAAPTPPLPSAR